MGSDPSQDCPNLDVETELDEEVSNWRQDVEKDSDGKAALCEASTLIVSAEDHICGNVTGARVEYHQEEIAPYQDDGSGKAESVERKSSLAAWRQSQNL